MQKLIRARYGAFEVFDIDLLDRIMKWCEERNELVHGLISLNHYKKYDEEFKKLAEIGVSLVFELYNEGTTFRNHWYEIDEPKEEFPVKKCRCNKQCINANSI